MKRAIATITVFVYGKTDQDLINESRRYQNALLSMDDNNANVESLNHSKFGSVDPDDHQKINLQ